MSYKKVNTLFLLFGLTTLLSCGEKSSSDEEIVQKAVNEELEAREKENELQDLKNQIEAQNRSQEPSEDILWSLDQLAKEQMFCEDSLWHKPEDQIHDVERFCVCRTQLIAVRWPWEEYQRSSFRYLDSLEQSGRLDRCLNPSKFATEKTEKAESEEIPDPEVIPNTEEESEDQ